MKRTAVTAFAVSHGAVQVSPERQQAIGVRLAVVSRLTGTRQLRTTGRVAADENRRPAELDPSRLLNGVT